MPKVLPHAFQTAPRSREPRFSKLRQMQCFPEVHKRICDGWSLSQLAKWIQNERNEYKDIGPDSLTATLHEYRASLPSSIRAGKTLPVAQAKAAMEIAEGLDELVELERLVHLQMERIEIDFSKEKQIKKLLTTMTPEIKEARQLLMAHAQLKMDLGLTQRHLGTAEVEVSVPSELAAKYGSEAVQKVLENDGSRRRLLGIAERLLKASATGSLTDDDDVASPELPPLSPPLEPEPEPVIEEDPEDPIDFPDGDGLPFEGAEEPKGVA